MDIIDRITDRMKARFTKRADFMATFDTPTGRRVLADILKSGHFTETITAINDGGAGDPILSAFRDGERTQALNIVKVLNWTDEDIMALQKQEKSYEEDFTQNIVEAA